MKPAFRWYVKDRYGKRHTGCYRARCSHTLFKRLKREYPRAETIGYYL